MDEGKGAVIYRPSNKPDRLTFSQDNTYNWIMVKGFRCHDNNCRPENVGSSNPAFTYIGIMEIATVDDESGYEGVDWT